MRTRQQIYLLIAAATAATACVGPEPLEPPTAPKDMTQAVSERKRLSASGRFLAPPPTTLALTSPPTVASLDISPDLSPTFLSLVAYNPADLGPASERTEHGGIRPTKGDSFLVLSTGRSGGDDAELAEPGLDFPPALEEGDAVTFRFQVTIPPHVNRLSFDYNFLSAEAPEYVGSEFNDTFTVRITDAIGTDRVAASASVNSSTFHLVSATTVGEVSPFMLLATDAAGVNLPPFNGQKPDAGTTGFQRVDVLVDGDADDHVTIELDIRDVGDGIVDSVVLIDNVEFSAIEVVDPYTGDPATDLIDNAGKVSRDHAAISTQGRPVNSVAADGITQTILRSRVSGPGQATFAFPAGESPMNGSLSANEETLLWADSVTVDAVLVGSEYYVFALYQGPADFNREGVDGDVLLKSRAASLTMTYTPTPPTTSTEFEQPFTISIVRPAVVVVPEIWSSCGLWSEGWGLGAPVDPTVAPDDPRLAFTVTCADYERTSAQGFAANSHIVRAYIHQALQQQRAPGVAATQVDVIGHGVGGLLVRKHIDELDFIRPDNFNAGSINRLITMNTPHLGSRMADEIVRFRESMKASVSEADFNEVIGDFNALGIRINNEAGDRMIDELTSQHAMINGIGQSNVRHHVMYTTSGHSIPRDIAMPPNLNAAGLTLKLASLFDYMEWYHPLVRDLLVDDPDRKKLIFGEESLIFCGHPSTPAATSSDDHDLFLTQAEQLGGLSPADLDKTSPFIVEYIDGDIESNYTEHFFVSNGIGHLIRLTELLSLPVSSDFFGDSMPSPAGIDRENSCPVITPLAALAPKQLPVHALTPGGSITISSPAAGTTVAPGSNVTVIVQPSGGAQPAAVLIMGPDGSRLVEQSPFKAILKIPDEAIGAVSFRAVAFYGPGIAFANVPVNVEVAATLTSLEVLNGDAVLERPGHTRQLRIFGNYSDGIRRDITAPELGTQYSASSLTGTASVSASGLITAEAPGYATIVVRNGITLTSINLTVGEPRCGDGVRDPGEACDDGNVTNGDGCSSACLGENRPPSAVCQSPTACNDPGLCSAEVALGAGSTDPDGDPLSITQSPAGPYAVGQHAVAVSVSDGEVGAQCVAQLEVQDCEPPTLSCPANFTAECTGGGGIVLAPPPATASDNCSVAVNAPAGGQLPLGDTELAYSASDPAGNGASCTTTVTVQDTIAPTITCPPPATAECTGNSQATVDPGVAVASDLCTGVSVTKPSDGPYPLGTTPVVFTAKDKAGNQASCTSTVKVVDTTPPQLSLTPPAPLWPLDHLYRTITLDDCHPVVQDACGGVLAPSTYQAAITCVTSDEPDNTVGTHDGDTIDDIVIVNGTTVKLRAERHSSFDGRMYKIHFKVRDGAGNLTNGVCPVMVPYYECKPEDAECACTDSGVASSVCH